MKASCFADTTGAVRVVLCCEETGFTEALSGLLDSAVIREGTAELDLFRDSLMKPHPGVAPRGGVPVEAFRQVYLIVPDSSTLTLSLMGSDLLPTPIPVHEQSPQAGETPVSPAVLWDEPPSKPFDGYEWVKKLSADERELRQALLGSDPRYEVASEFARSPSARQTAPLQTSSTRPGQMVQGTLGRPSVFIFFPHFPPGIRAAWAAGNVLAGIPPAVLTSVVGGAAARRMGCVPDRSGNPTGVPPYLHLYSGCPATLPETIAVPRIDGTRNEWTASLLSSNQWVEEFRTCPGRNRRDSYAPVEPADMAEAERLVQLCLPANFVPIMGGRGWFCQTPVADIYLMPSGATPEEFAEATRPMLAFSGMCRAANQFVRAFRDAVRETSSRSLPSPDASAESGGTAASGAHPTDLRGLACLVWDSGSLEQASRQLLVAAKARSEPILICGETGCGKELAAATIHCLSGTGGSLIRVNCACIPSSLGDSILFGHERGAFTGAIGTTDGVVQRAANGTLFLDEIHWLGAETRMKLLRVLQDGEYTKLGGTKILKAGNMRIVAATNDDDFTQGHEQWKSGLLERFRHIIRLPPLRDRPQDIPGLVRLLLKQATAAVVCDPTWVRTVVASGTEALVRDCLRRDWARGNVRELQNHVAGWFWDLYCQRHFMARKRNRSVSAHDILDFVGMTDGDSVERRTTGRPMQCTDAQLTKVLHSCVEERQTKGEAMRRIGIRSHVPRRIVKILDPVLRTEALCLWAKLPRKPKGERPTRSRKATSRNPTRHK